MCGSRARAEDVVQEAFLSLWRSGDRYDRSRGQRALVDPQRCPQPRGRRVPPRGDARGASQSRRGWPSALPSAELTETEAERRDDAERVRGALRELPEEQRKVIELSYFGGFTPPEIAEILSLPPGTVKGRMRLGLSKLRVALDLEGALP